MQIHSSRKIFLIDETVKCVRVQYEPEPPDQLSKTHIAKTFLDLEYGEFVAIETSTRWGITVVRVVEVGLEPELNDTSIPWIVAPVFLDDYNEWIEREKIILKTIAAAEKRKQREELKTTILGNLNPEEIKQIGKD